MKIFNLVVILFSVGGIVAMWFSPTLAILLWSFPIGSATETAYRELMK